MTARRTKTEAATNDEERSGYRTGELVENLLAGSLGIRRCGGFMMDAYKSWVRRNSQWISSFESLANTMTWFLPERFTDSELTHEAVTSLLGLVTAVNQHIIETTPRPRGQGVGPHQMAVQEPEHDESFPWSLCISVMKEVEVLTEMAAQHYLGKDKKWGPVASMEAIKVLIRLIILHKSGYKMLLDGGESKNVAEEQGTSHSQQQQEFGRPLQNHPALQSMASRDSSNPDLLPMEGRAIQAMHRFSETITGSSRPSWQQQRQSPRQSRAQEPLSYNPRPVSLEPKQESYTSRAFIGGEVLLVTRPLVYVLLLWRYGLKSWRPWGAALSIDLAGMYLVSGSTSFPQRNMCLTGLANLQQGASTPLSTHEVLELRRRKIRWALYVMRSPFFDQYTRRPVEAVEKILSPIPLVGMLAYKAVDLLLAVQGFYSYTAAS